MLSTSSFLIQMFYWRRLNFYTVFFITCIRRRYPLVTREDSRYTRTQFHIQRLRFDWIRAQNYMWTLCSANHSVRPGRWLVDPNTLYSYRQSTIFTSCHLIYNTWDLSMGLGTQTHHTFRIHLWCSRVYFWILIFIKATAYIEDFSMVLNVNMILWWWPRGFPTLSRIKHVLAAELGS